MNELTMNEPQMDIIKIIIDHANYLNDSLDNDQLFAYVSELKLAKTFDEADEAIGQIMACVRYCRGEVTAFNALRADLKSYNSLLEAAQANDRLAKDWFMTHAKLGEPVRIM